LDETWVALAREAGMAAEHLAIGATAFSKADYARHAYFAQGLFAFSVGIERSCKLGLAVDHAIDNAGRFPDSRRLRDYGHDLRLLLETLEEIGQRRSVEPPWNRCPDSDIHRSIISIFTNFATNVTRYYNLEAVADRTIAVDDPFKAWYEQVTKPVIELHMGRATRRRIDRQASEVATALAGNALTRFHGYDGTLITSPFDLSRLTGETEFARRWERMYVLQIARFISVLLGHLGGRTEFIPYFNEFYGMFYNEDDFLRQRKTWSIYGL